MIRVQIENKKELVLYFALVFTGAVILSTEGYFPFSGISELIFFMIVLWLISLFVKVKIEEVKE